MIQYAKALGMVLIVFGLGGLAGVFHKAYATGAMDWTMMLGKGFGFAVLVPLGVYFMVIGRASKVAVALKQQKADAAAKMNALKKR